VKGGAGSVFLNDTLADTAGNTLESRAGWSKTSGTAVFDNASPTAVMFTASPTLYVNSAVAPGPNHEVSADYVIVTKITSNFSRLYCRYDDATDSGLYLHYSNGAARWEFVKRVSASSTTLGTYSPVAPGNGTTWTCKITGTVSGGTLTANFYINGVLRGGPYSITDAVLLTGAKVALWHTGSVETNTTGTHIKNLIGRRL